MNQSKTHLLTVGLPFFNNQTTLANAIKSILIQSYKNFELILIDDGSTDNSYNIAYEISKMDKRIKLISDGENKGLVFRLNQIIDLALGEYIARMDSDDMMMPNKLESQMNFLERNPALDVIDTAAYIINEYDEPTGIRGMEDITTNKKEVLKKVLLFHPTVIAKTSWYRENKYSDFFLRAEDYELWNRTFANTRFYRVKTPLFIYREGNVNVKNYLLSMQSVRKIIKQYGPGLLNKEEIVTEILKTYLKSSLYVFFGLFNLQQFLSSQRNQKLDKDQIEKVRNVINLIKVPHSCQGSI
jgi:glycosyltransferase involved in cell wall biosynthesis